MEPISSASSARATASQPPVPAQQRRDDQALTAPQPRDAAVGPSAPNQELQLQRRQVVEDIGKNQQVTTQLQEADQQLQQAQALAEQASSNSLSGEQRTELGQRFDETRANLDNLARSVGQGSADRLRVNSGIASAEEARTTAQSIDQARAGLGTELSALSQQAQVLGADFPRTTQRNNVEPQVRSEQQANALSTQVQRQIQAQPDNALASQANVSRQTALTLFQ